MSLCALPKIDVSSYQPHALHGAERAWAETNCYIDVWVEVLHAQDLNPLACLSMVFANDFDGDQWTFYKPPHEDLFALYGIDVQELNVWRGLLPNACEQLRRGRLVLTESDSFYLPDTSGTDYRSNHVKTTIAIQEIDIDAQRMGYFHNSSYHELHGEDFVETFRIGKPYDPTFMPLFAEFVRLDRLQRRDDAALAKIALSLLHKHIARRPEHNPVTAFAPVFLSDVENLKEQGMAAYHAYAFATLRQLGAGFSLGAQYLRWLEQHGQGDFRIAAQEFDSISDTTKTLLLKTARAVMGKKAVDLSPLTQQLAHHWTQGMTALTHSLKKVG
ncbi:DUF1839 family protein [Undibacterium jejuense]|uniref:DUF1839 family protein n=1 Tax=Undibacterium jejuense TaxID=1344949 RepID=A0A923HJC2_9BURK|nr:DUF1839 family protein [Undibacterium jejuense]MBC3862787.1 DUF1839 family protein [Undibacterium jejuense]